MHNSKHNNSNLFKHYIVTIHVSFLIILVVDNIYQIPEKITGYCGIKSHQNGYLGSLSTIEIHYHILSVD